jgi:hypothetical protein
MCFTQVTEFIIQEVHQREITLQVDRPEALWQELEL